MNYRFLRLVILFALASSLCGTARAVLVNLDGSNRVASITTLDVAGTFYDATMHYDVANWTAYKALPVTDITFSTVSTAETAIDSILAAIANDLAIAAVPSGTGALFVPYRDNGATADVWLATHRPGDPYSSFPSIANKATSTVLAGMPPSEGAWVSFAPAAIPEPSAFLCVGLIGLGYATRNRRRRIAR